MYYALYNSLLWQNFIFSHYHHGTKYQRLHSLKLWSADKLVSVVVITSTSVSSYRALHNIAPCNWTRLHQPGYIIELTLTYSTQSTMSHSPMSHFTNLSFTCSYSYTSRREFSNVRVTLTCEATGDGGVVIGSPGIGASYMGVHQKQHFLWTSWGVCQDLKSFIWTFEVC